MSSPREREYFQFMAYRWDVTAAHELARHLPVQQLHAEPLYPWLPVIGIDEVHAAQVDLSEPVLVARVANMDGTTMLIDGWHRLHRARAEGLTHLPCRVIDEEQELKVRLLGGRNGPPHRRKPPQRRQPRG